MKDLIAVFELAEKLKINIDHLTFQESANLVVEIKKIMVDFRVNSANKE